MYTYLFMALSSATNMIKLIVVILKCVKRKIANTVYLELLEQMRKLYGKVVNFVLELQTETTDVEMMNNS